MIPVDDNFVTVRGATGQNPKAYVLKPLKFELEKQVGIHIYIYIYIYIYIFVCPIHQNSCWGEINWNKLDLR